MAQSDIKEIKVGVGLRHPHYQAALLDVAPVDFVEVHAENFFADGGAAPALIDNIAQHYPISLHSTALGLGSLKTINNRYMQSFLNLVERVNPCLLSDHVAFCWGEVNGKPVHAGDLLPLAFNEENNKTMCENIEFIQDKTGRQLLIENLSAYLTPSGSSMSETEFLTTLCDRTGCALLLDLNNLIVNAHNLGVKNGVQYGTQWLAEIPDHAVAEIHLAGFTPVAAGEIAIDDHSQAVSEDVWQLYQHALLRFGPVPTLIEWDQQLPSWEKLIAEATQARTIAQQVLSHG